ncbi:hypothetical protein OTU49_010126, partial [Cherax quadricarinatus]
LSPLIPSSFLFYVFSPLPLSFISLLYLFIFCSSITSINLFLCFFSSPPHLPLPFSASSFLCLFPFLLSSGSSLLLLSLFPLLIYFSSCDSLPSVLLTSSIFICFLLSHVS